MKCILCETDIDESNDSFVKSNGTFCKKCYEETVSCCWRPGNIDMEEEEHA